MAFLTFAIEGAVSVDAAVIFGAWIGERAGNEDIFVDAQFETAAVSIGATAIIATCLAAGVNTYAIGAEQSGLTFIRTIARFTNLAVDTAGG